MPDTNDISFALNQKTVPDLPFTAFLDLAADLGCVGVEARNDLGRPIFDGKEPAVAGRLVRERDLRLLGLSEVYPFDDWTEERRGAVASLIDLAHRAGAETVSFVPRVDGKPPTMFGAPAQHREILSEVLTLAEGTDVVPLVEPIGFPGCSIRYQRDLIDVIESLGASGRIGMVHDTFQHTLADDQSFGVEHIRLVHVSGVAQGPEPLTESDDGLRGLLDAEDRTHAFDQIEHLLSAGYCGAFSFEATAQHGRFRAEPRSAITNSMHFVLDRLHRCRKN